MRVTGRRYADPPWENFRGWPSNWPWCETPNRSRTVGATSRRLGCPVAAPSTLRLERKIPKVLLGSQAQWSPLLALDAEGRSARFFCCRRSRRSRLRGWTPTPKFFFTRAASSSLRNDGSATRACLTNSSTPGVLVGVPRSPLLRNQSRQPPACKDRMGLVEGGSGETKGLCRLAYRLVFDPHLAQLEHSYFKWNSFGTFWPIDRHPDIRAGPPSD